MRNFTLYYTVVVFLIFFILNAEDSLKNLDKTSFDTLPDSSQTNQIQQREDTSSVVLDSESIPIIKSSDTVSDSVFEDEEIDFFQGSSDLNEEQSQTGFTDTEKQDISPKKDSILQVVKLKNVLVNLKNFFRRYFFHIILLVIFGCIIFCTVLYFLRRVDENRFLTSTRLSVMDKELQIACKYIEKNFYNPDLSLKLICSELVTGEAFIEALFERELGMSIYDFIVYVRINRAKILLEKKKNLSAEEIIEQIGFTDINIFLSQFKKVTGVAFEKYVSSSSTTP